MIGLRGSEFAPLVTEKQLVNAVMGRVYEMRL